MIVIAHRGNTNGPSKEENNPRQINKALALGFDVEIDVWYVNDSIYLGHDEPTYHVTLEYLKNQHFWCHAKNIEALEYMMRHDVHCFWHDNDDYVLTSNGWIWAYPAQPGNEKTISVMPEMATEVYPILGAYGGVCTDYPYQYIDTQ